MAYSRIEELPSEVRNSLDDDDMKVWMDTYNGLSESGAEPREAYKETWHRCMRLPSSFAFKTYASVEAVDSDGEVIGIKSLKDNMDTYIEEGGKVQQVHSNYQVGTVWDYEEGIHPETNTPCIIVYGNVFGGDGSNAEYTKAREDFLNGQNAMSIGGDASFEGQECTASQCFTKRNITELMEISLCTTPANPYAQLIWYNDKAVAKSKDGIMLKVLGTDVHRSYDSCSYETVARSLRSCGVECDCRITHEGCRVSTSDETGLMKAMDGFGFRYSYDLRKGDFIVRYIEGELHNAFAEGIRKGWLDREDFSIGDSCPATTLAVLKDKGFVRRFGNEWRMVPDVLKDAGAMTAQTAGAVNPVYSDDPEGKAILTYEEIMDWRSRLMKE